MPITPAFEQWRREGKTYRHRGRPIFYRDAGSGPVLLAIHGFPSASYDWHAVWPALTARFRVVAPDMIGLGWSDKPRDYAYSVLDQADLHAGLLRELGVERVHILAHDLGVSVAQELLARQHVGEPSVAIDSICFLNGGVFPESHRPLLVQRVLASRVGPLVARFMRKQELVRGLNRALARPMSDDLSDEMWQLMRHRDGRLVLPKLLGYMAERRQQRERWVRSICEARIPLRLIDGTVDPISGKTLVARYREMIPNADVVELAHAGHYPQLEDPAAVQRAFFLFHDAHQTGARPPD
jgi:pimeloyl-ACP methyl ester carboxylesterase